MKRAFEIDMNRFSESAEEIETKVFKETQNSKPQPRMTDSSYQSSPHGSVGSTYIPSLSLAQSSNSQISSMSPALRTPGSVFVDHSPADDAGASLQGSLQDTIARHNRKRKHRTPSPTNPQDPTTSVLELNDAQDRTDLSAKKFKNSGLGDFLNNLENDEDFRWKLVLMLNEMNYQEKDQQRKEEIISVRGTLLKLGVGSMLPGCTYDGAILGSEVSLDLCKTRIREWVTDRLPPPPPVEDFKFKRKDGKLIVTWTSPKWPIPLRYCGEWVESSGKKRDMKKFQNIAETSYELSKVSPIRGYFVTVWAVDQTGQKGKEKKSRGILCEKYESIYVDDSSRLRPGYKVYKGYLNSTSSELDRVAVKRVEAEDLHALREVDALLALKEHQNVVTYRSSTQHKKWIYIAMELCSTDTFQELVVNNKLNMHCCKISLLHMMLGLAAIHEKNILHRDLKPQNILRSLDGENMKVADFSLCKEMDSNKSKVSKSAFEIGTDGWGSPEHYQPNAKMSPKSDIYSGGLVAAFGLSHGQHVYGSKAYDWKPGIIEGRKMDLSILACNEVEIAKDMILKMLERVPGKRLSAEQVLAHPFFWDDKKKLEFLHQMKVLFFTPEQTTPEQVTSIKNELKEKTKDGVANWVKKMDENPVVAERYQHVLSTAKGLVPRKPKYDPTSVFDLIRFIRNVEEHIEDYEEFKDDRSNVWKLFYGCFPTLLCTVYNAFYERFPGRGNCSDFPKNATRFFTELATYQPLPIP